MECDAPKECKHDKVIIAGSTALGCGRGRARNRSSVKPVALPFAGGQSDARWPLVATDRSRSVHAPSQTNDCEPEV
jgi:hypothetical protein